MNFGRVFLLRAAGLVLIASSLSVLWIGERWGSAAIPVLGWSTLWAVVLGVVGFHSLRKAMTCEPTKLMKVMMKGLIARVLILAASQGLVYLVYGLEWGQRTLMATVLLYLLVLGVEVFTLNQALKAGVWRGAAPTPTDNGETSEGDAGR